MTVSSSSNKVQYNGNGSTTVFAYTFKVFDQDDLTVIIRSANGTETVKTITTHYTVSGVGSAGGGNVTMLTAPASGETIVILREQDLIQEFDLVPNDPFPAQLMEDALDKLTFMVQQHSEELDRAIKASRTNTIGSTEFTISAASRANKIFAFDSAGELAVTQELGTYRGNWTTGTAFAQRDIVKDTSNGNIYICVTAHTSTGSQPISTNADAAKWALLVDAASATTSASAAASSASAAATSATNASNSASAAAGSASSASSSASTATTQASNASSSASSASTSATNAAASETAAAASASSASGSASTASTAATNASNSASTASTAATNASNSASSASTSATNASNSASSASTSATNAAASASAAATSETNAAASEAAAATSETNAAASETAAAASAALAADRVAKTADTGSAVIPTGTQAQRDGTPSAGYFRFNSDVTKFEGYNGTSWGSVGGGATGGGSDEIFIENGQTVTTNYTITTNKNAMSTGPISINSGVTVTVSSGSNWVVL